MPQKWNLQDIVPPERSRPATRPQVRRVSDMRPRTAERTPEPVRGGEEEVHPRIETAGDAPERVDIIDGRSSKVKKIILIAITVLVLGAIGFAITLLLRGADVTVYPKFKVSTVQATFAASQQPRSGDLGYELLSLEEEGERRVSATGQEEVSLRAEGAITIFNAFSSNPQRLIKNTRFESPDGLVYRIDDSVVVPGYTKRADGSIEPGSITAQVFADGPGESYDIGKARFTIPGLKDTDQYELMYAESTEAGITGGFEGMRFIIDENELATTRQELQMELRDKLLARVASEKPAGFVLYESAITFTYDSLPATEAGEREAIIKERARLHVPLFENASFASFIAQNTIAGYEGAPVRLEDPLTLSFSYPSDSEDISIEQELTFNLTGSTKIIWTFDHEALKNDLLGVSKSALPTVLSGYPAIGRAEAVVRPFWQQSFPKDPDEIEIIEQLALE